MKTLLRMLKDGETFRVGPWEIWHGFSDIPDKRLLGCRHRESGLMAPWEHGTVAGLDRLLRWIDEQEAAVVRTT